MDWQCTVIICTAIICGTILLLAIIKEYAKCCRKKRESKENQEKIIKLCENENK